VTIKDIMAGLAHMELWSRELRFALQTMDRSQEIPFTPSRALLSAPRVSDGLCPPPDDDDAGATSAPTRRPVPKRKPKPPRGRTKR
jgi:hypothetical protein